MGTQLLVNGRFYSSTAPDATAMAVSDGVVVWLGAEQPGLALHPAAEIIDLAGDWVAPAFLDLFATQSNAQTGILAGRTTETQRCAADAPDLPQRLAAHTSARTPLIITNAIEATVEKLVDAIAAVRVRVGSPAIATANHQLEQPGPLPEAAIEALAAAGFGFVIAPTAADHVSLAAVVAAGAKLALGSGGTQEPAWSGLNAASTGDRALSPRAAFTAATRGAWRVSGTGTEWSGMLVPGAPATYAIWRADELFVTAAQDSVQRWSTDPRSRVPGLPDFTEAPQCRQLVVDGVAVDA